MTEEKPPDPPPRKRLELIDADDSYEPEELGIPSRATQVLIGIAIMLMALIAASAAIGFDICRLARALDWQPRCCMED